MLNARDHLLSTAMTRSTFRRGDDERWAVRSALKLYERTCRRGWLFRLWARLTGRGGRLIRLSDVQASCPITARCYVGVETVPLRQICGSMGRCEDFDAAFHPRRSHSRDRWLSIAVARQRGTVLPPVELIRVGDLYVVRDGHHRISVARAMGQTCIEADVVAWQVAGSLPWQRPASPADRLRGLSVPVPAYPRSSLR